MFGFQHGSLDISKDVAYDSNTLFNTLYQISMALMQGKQWVVTSSQYKIVDDNVSNNSQDTILMLGIATFVVKIIAFGKITKDERENIDAHIQFSNILPFCTFIELFDSSSSGNITPSSLEGNVHPSPMEL